MKIHALALKDFTRFTATTVGFDDTISVIVAENAAGKTSIVDAITYCLTGHRDRTDKAGRGAEAMIRTGAKEAGVGLKIGPDELTVSRSIPGGLKIDGHEGGQKELQEFLYEIIGAGDGAVTAALNTHAFLDLSTQDQKSLLFGLLGLELTPGAIESMIVAEAVKITGRDETIRLLEAAPRNLYQGGPGEVFASLYKHFYELRRNFKRDLKALGEQAPLSLVPDAPDKDHLTGEIEGLEQLLYEVKSQRDAAVEARERAATTASQIAHVKEQLKEAGDPEAAAQELKIVQEDIANAHLKEKNLIAKAVALHDAIKALKAAGADRDCPLAPGIVACPLTKPKRLSLIEELTAKAAVLEGEAGEARDAAFFLEPKREELNARACVADKSLLEGKLEHLEMVHKELPTALNPDTAHSEIVDLQDRIAERKAALEEIVRAEGARAATERQAAERARLTDEVEVLQVLAELTGPKGIPGRLLYETLGPLQNLANDRLTQLTGGRYFMHFEVDPDFRIIVTHDDVESDLKRLSSSEKMRIGVVLQDAIIRLSGLRLMILDNCDVLDPKNRALLMDTLLTISPDYDQIIVLSTVGPNGATNPHIDGVSVYLLEDGQFEKVGEEAMVG